MTSKKDFVFPTENNEDFFRMLIDESPEGVLVMDAVGVVQFANPAAMKIMSFLDRPLIGYQFDLPDIRNVGEIKLPNDGAQRFNEMKVTDITWKGQPGYLALLPDVSLQKSLEAHFKKREGLLLETGRIAKVGGWEINMDEDTVWWSEVARAIHEVDKGFKPGLEEALSFFPGEARETLRRAIERLREAGTPYDLELPFVTAKEKERYVRTIGKAEFKDGKCVRIWGTFQDITEQKDIEMLSKKRAEQFGTLFKTMLQGVVIQDADGEIINANPAAEQILGLSLAEMQGRTPMNPDWAVINLKDEPISGETYPSMVALRTGKKVENLIYGVYNPKREEHVWIYVSAVPWFHAGEDQPYQVITTFQDISNTVNIQKDQEKRLKELECLSTVMLMIQQDPSMAELCRRTTQVLVKAMNYPEMAVAVIELDGERYITETVAEHIQKRLHAPIRSQNKIIGRVSVFYKIDKRFELPEEPDLLHHIADLLTSYYERVQSQEKLKESEGRFRSAIMDAPNPIMIHAEDGAVVMINNAWTEISGYSPDEISTVSDWVQHVEGVNNQELEQRVRDDFKYQERPNKNINAFTTKSGDVRLWEFSSNPLGMLPDGRRTAITMATDITSRERYLSRTLALREIDQVIGSTLNLNEVLNRITPELGKLLDYESMAVMLLEGDEMVIIAGQGFDTAENVIGEKFRSEPGDVYYDVVQRRAPITSLDISKDYPTFIQPDNLTPDERIKSWLGVPLISQGGVIGMFSIDRTREDAFTQDDIDIAMQFANRAAISIQNAQLYTEKVQYIEQLEVMRQVDVTINGIFELSDALPVILRQIRDGLEVDAASIHLYQEETRQLGSHHAVGLNFTISPELKIDLGQGYTGRVAQTWKKIFKPEIGRTGSGNKYPIDFSAEGIVSFFGLPLIAKGKLLGVLQLMHRSRLDPDKDWENFAETLAGQAAIAVDNIALISETLQANIELINAYDETIEGWARALDLRDSQTEGHSWRVVKLSLRLAEYFGFDEAVLAHFKRGVFLHDIGKMAIPDKILQKPGPLTDDEWVIMKQHPEFAYNMLKDIDFLTPALNIPHYHQERWDGSGYPDGLAGEDIPLAARIFAVVDVWDALTSDRYYRDAWSRAKTIAYLTEEAGKTLDPEVVAVFLDIIQNEFVVWGGRQQD